MFSYCYFILEIVITVAHFVNVTKTQPLARVKFLQVALHNFFYKSNIAVFILCHGVCYQNSGQCHITAYDIAIKVLVLSV